MSDGRDQESTDLGEPEEERDGTAAVNDTEQRYGPDESPA